MASLCSLASSAQRQMGPGRSGQGCTLQREQGFREWNFTARSGPPPSSEALPVVLVPGGHAAIDDDVGPEAVHVHGLRHLLIQVLQGRLHARQALTTMLTSMTAGSLPTAVQHELRLEACPRQQHTATDGTGPEALHVHRP